MSFRDIAWLCGQTKLPVIAKGILRGDDAVMCLDHGASGIFVSNHGGRQLDTAPSTISVLPEIVDAVKAVARCYWTKSAAGRMWSRRLALGACCRSPSAALPLWGLAVDGESEA
ncbi:MAG: alpha-hydroxy-acid oxidizing protein [Planctomycetaceae bacterium]